MWMASEGGYTGLTSGHSTQTPIYTSTTRLTQTCTHTQVHTKRKHTNQKKDALSLSLIAKREATMLDLK